MHLLAFDTSTDALSVAVMRSTPTGPLYWQHQGAGGAAASGSLIAAIMDLLRQADVRLQDLDAICFGSGPGSFTGLRTACSVAQGLAYGAGVPVLPVPSLLALAQTARAAHAPEDTQGCVSALLDARMDEVYAATYAFAGDVWTTVQSPCLLAPEQVAVWSQAAAALQPACAALWRAALATAAAPLLRAYLHDVDFAPLGLLPPPHAGAPRVCAFVGQCPTNRGPGAGPVFQARPGGDPDT